MKPTDVRQPDYFHKVVDCQWACPAHTNVPEYIRMVAQGRYDDAYLLNRDSNVFPGILGRTCNRPCEPACRRVRVEEKPVAICRIKRVAADLKGDISARLPKAPATKNGKRVACIGAGPASLTVANDLMPLGYEVVVFEKNTRPGGLMRTNVPSFRLPAAVLDEEIAMIVDMGVEVRYGTPVQSLKALLGSGFDAVFVGSGAPRGKDLDLPGRKEAAERIHIGIDWLESVAFDHIGTIGEHVLIIGVGNTAMDCCRTARRLGGKDVKVMARRDRQHFKASPWELEDAEEEQVDILVNHVPTRFVLEKGKLVGMEFERPAASGTGTEKIILRADDVIVAIGQENAFPFIERDIGIEFGKWDMPKVDEKTMASTRPGVFFGGDAAWGPKNIIWAVAHGHEAAIPIDNHCQGVALTERPTAQMSLVTQKMGLTEWSYSNDYNSARRAKMKHVDLKERFKQLSIEVEMGFDHEQTVREVERCLNCDVQTAFTDKRCIECDAYVDVCPTSCLTIVANAEEPELRQRLTVPAENTTQALFVSGGLPQTGRVMVKDEDVCVHCGLCAERCPTAAWDMARLELTLPKAGQRGKAPGIVPAESLAQVGASTRPAFPPPDNRQRRDKNVHQKQVIRTNDFALKLANVNGTGSASANGLLMQAIFRMGIPVSGKNLFPSNIQGLPTWYEVRVSKAGHTARALDYDLCIAMNVETYARDVKEVRSGGALLYDSSWPLDASLARADVTFLGVPLARMCNEIFNDSRERILMKNIAYLGTLVALLDIDMGVIDELLDEKFSKKKALRDSNHKALRAGYDFAIENFECPLPIRLEKMHATDDRILIDGNTAMALGCVYAGATVAAWYPITPATSVMDSFKELCAEYRKDPETGKNNYCIVQAEDELAAIGMVIGASWNGARAFTSTAGPGISLMSELIGLAYYAEIPAVIVDVQRTGPSTGMPTRTQQGDILSCAYASHGDTKHILLFPSHPGECFTMAVEAFDLAERFQTPVFVLSDLDIGMNDWVCPRLKWDDGYRPNRGRVLGAAELEKMTKFFRYSPENEDHVAARTLPGVNSKGAFFTRGSGHNKLGHYTEVPDEYQEVMDRLARKHKAAAAAVPAAILHKQVDAAFGIISLGGCDPAVREAVAALAERGIIADYLRVRGFPFGAEVEAFLAAHERVFVIEQNRDAQLRTLLTMETSAPKEKLRSVLVYGGFPLSSRHVIEGITGQLGQLAQPEGAQKGSAQQGRT